MNKSVLVALTVIGLTVTAAAIENKLVVYSNNVAQVYESRQMSIHKGLQTTYLQNFPVKMYFSSLRLEIPQGVRLNSLGILTYDDIIPFDKASLLKKMVGEKIYLLIEGNYKEAKLLQADKFIVVELDGKTIVDPSYDVAMDKGILAKYYTIPEKRDSSETYPVEVRLDSKKDWQSNVPVTYIVSDLSWHAVYNLYFDDARSRLDMEVGFQLGNHTGKDLIGYQLELVSGQMRFDYRGQPVVPRMMMAKAAMLDAEAAPREDFAGNFSEFGDYYSIAYMDTVTLKNGADRILRWREFRDIPVKKHYIFNFNGVGSLQSIKQNATIKLTFINDKASQINERLPAGEAYVYKTGPSVGLIGKISIPMVTIGEEVNLVIGNASDLLAKKKHLEHLQVDRRTTTDKYRLELINASKRAQLFEVEEAFYGDWTVLQSTAKYEKKDSRTLRYVQEIKAGETVVIEYMVQQKSN